MFSGRGHFANVFNLNRSIIGCVLNRNQARNSICNSSKAGRPLFNRSRQKRHFIHIQRNKSVKTASYTIAKLYGSKNRPKSQGIVDIHILAFYVGFCRGNFFTLHRRQNTAIVLNKTCIDQGTISNYFVYS